MVQSSARSSQRSHSAVTVEPDSSGWNTYSPVSASQNHTIHTSPPSESVKVMATSPSPSPFRSAKSIAAKVSQGSCTSMGYTTCPNSSWSALSR